MLALTTDVIAVAAVASDAVVVSTSAVLLGNLTHRWAQNIMAAGEERLSEKINPQSSRAGMRRKKVGANGIQMRRKAIQVRQKLQSCKNGGPVRPANSPLVIAARKTTSQTKKHRRRWFAGNINRKQMNVYTVDHALKAANRYQQVLKHRGLSTPTKCF